MTTSRLTADGAANAAAILTDTIVREQLKRYDPEAIRPFVLDTFRACLEELMQGRTYAATLEQVVHLQGKEG